MKKEKKHKTAKSRQPIASSNVKRKNTIIKFFAIFLLGIVLFYVFYYSAWYKNQIREGLLAFQAELGANMLRMLGYEVATQKGIINSNQFSMSIKNGCDGLEATAIFLSAVLAFPTTFKLKIPGIVLGFMALFLANQLRIVGLFMIGTHWRSAFELFHLHGGLVLFMFFALIVLLLWVNWTLHQEKKYAAVR